MLCVNVCVRSVSVVASGPGAGGAVRRASERDLPARLAAEAGVKSSKSTPALHHVASPPTHHHTPPSVSVSGAATGAGGAAWPSKSRSSHNLAAPAQHDAFYQNLSTVHSQQHALQDSSTGSNRPQSAHFAAGGQTEAPDSPLHHQVCKFRFYHTTYTSAARAAKLAEMSDEVARRHAYHNHNHHTPPRTIISSVMSHTLRSLCNNVPHSSTAARAAKLAEMSDEVARRHAYHNHNHHTPPSHHHLIGNVPHSSIFMQ
ncbi:hypothetical protein HF086_015244 [Spodoptera exigua]|uniref:Uncharacterized protein n=1 Tax=Spodoptera exigua TaxID=7107 RepID=A0A922M993_SPOEX|nr:hypothetical protein HF086_015244 [Spodoptera exigua]